MKGRRVETSRAVLDGEAGDYYPVVSEDDPRTILALWCRIPTGSIARLPSGHSDEDGPKWSIEFEDDGTVTVDPSIQQHTTEAGGVQIPEWHGYLRKGEWSSA